MTETVHEPARQTPVLAEVDVAVAGGGTAGVAAAVTAARLGLSVAMVEQTAIPGGLVTHLTTWLSDFDNKGGFAREFVEHLTAQGICEWPNYSPFPVVPYFDDLLAGAGVRPLYMAMAAAPLVEENRLRGVIVESKGGRQALRAKVVIDATGDGDVAARAGASYRVGREADGACQAISLSHLIMNYTGPALEHEEFAALAARAAGEAGSGFRLPYDRAGIRPMAGSRHAVFHGVPHVTGLDALSADGLSEALVALRRQARDLFYLLRDHTDEFAGAEFGPFSGLPGVRESRRIDCDATVTEKGVFAGERFEDGLFTVTQAVDIHKRTDDERSVVIVPVKPYQVPYGALLPAGLEGIMVAGRCIGGEHEAVGSYRIIADCFAMGEAAGIAAKMALDAACGLREIAVGDLVDEMARRGYER